MPSGNRGNYRCYGTGLDLKARPQMARDQEPHAGAVRELLRRYLYDNQSLGDNIYIQGPVYSGYNSRIFKVVSPRLPYPCALKFCLKPQTLEPDRQTAQQQFQTLRKISKRLTLDNRYRVALPQLLMEPEGALLIEWIDGKTMSDVVFRFGLSPRHAQSLLEQSAAWLHNFHAGHLQESGLLDTDVKLTVVEEIRQQKIIRGRLFDRCCSMLRQSAQATGSIELPQSWVHGDFTSDNLIISGETLFGIDIRAHREDVVIIDIAQFMNHLDLYLSGWQHPQLRIYKRRLIKHFMARYIRGNDSSLRGWKLPLAWLRVYMLLHSWNIASTRARGSLRGIILEHQYKAALARASYELRALL